MGKWASFCLGSSKVVDKFEWNHSNSCVIRVTDLADVSLPLTQWVTQTAIATSDIMPAGYVLALKANHPTLYGQVRLFKQSLKDLKVSTSAMSGKGHHRTEKCQVWCVSLASTTTSISSRWLWTYSVVSGGAATKPMEQNYPWGSIYLTSLEKMLAKLGQAIRLHWGIENSLHWTLDNFWWRRVRTDMSHKKNLALVTTALTTLNREQSFFNVVLPKILIHSNG